MKGVGYQKLEEFYHDSSSSYIWHKELLSCKYYVSQLTLNEDIEDEDGKDRYVLSDLRSDSFKGHEVGRKPRGVRIESYLLIFLMGICM